jgi:serine/threonine-protein kinase
LTAVRRTGIVTTACARASRAKRCFSLKRGVAAPVSATTGLATEILSQGTRRLRILTLLYAFTFFMASFMGRLLSDVDRARMIANPEYWIPDALSIGLALIVASFTFVRGVPVHFMMTLGLVFLVVSNYGIAIAEYLDPLRLDNNGWMGLSWVAVWTPLYTVAVPTAPRKAFPALALSVSSVPAMIGFMVATERTVFRPTPNQFFFWIVFPYLLVLVLGYVAARVVYDLGKQVTREKELGSYHLVELLGRGGMGEVWRARHRLLARPAAIKVIRPSLAQGMGVDGHSLERRFEREAQVTAQLRSPHTVELWDFGIADDGSFYYVMELLDGFDLDAFVKRFGPVPPERAVHLLRQVCHSLAEAEAKGLVHRDIKPSNIYICRYGEDYDFVKVLDFGIVKSLGTAASVTVSVSNADQLLQGTPAFIAPEQVLGAEIDGRVDIYATGCVAYWLLTGQLVFAADTTMGMLMRHAQTPAVPPSQRAEQPIPPALEEIVMACLEKDPAARPQSAGELSRLLGSIPELRPWSDERAREWWTSHL